MNDLCFVIESLFDVIESLFEREYMKGVVNDEGEIHLLSGCNASCP